MAIICSLSGTGGSRLRAHLTSICSSCTAAGRPAPLRRYLRAGVGDFLDPGIKLGPVDWASYRPT